MIIQTEFLDPIVALRVMAEQRRPCLDCGRPHECRMVPSPTRGVGPSWADPVDEHTFREMGSRQYAQAVLAHVEMVLGGRP